MMPLRVMIVVQQSRPLFTRSYERKPVSHGFGIEGAAVDFPNHDLVQVLPFVGPLPHAELVWPAPPLVPLRGIIHHVRAFPNRGIGKTPSGPKSAVSPALRCVTHYANFAEQPVERRGQEYPRICTGTVRFMGPSSETCGHFGLGSPREGLGSVLHSKMQRIHARRRARPAQNRPDRAKNLGRIGRSLREESHAGSVPARSRCEASVAEEPRSVAPDRGPASSAS